MGDAEELIREAEYAFRNIAPGSTSRSKYTARAKRLATRIVRRFPRSSEAEQARQILNRLRNSGELVPATQSVQPAGASRIAIARSPEPHSPSPHAVHPQEQQHSDHVVRTNVSNNSEADDWANTWQKVTSLTSPQKKVLGIILFFGFILFSVMPFLLLAVVYYAVKPQRIRKHVNGLLDAIA